MHGNIGMLVFRKYICLPVNFAVKPITPENTVVGHVQVQSHGVPLCRHHLTIIPLHQVDAPDLMPVSE